MIEGQYSGCTFIYNQIELKVVPEEILTTEFLEEMEDHILKNLYFCTYLKHATDLSRSELVTNLSIPEYLPNRNLMDLINYVRDLNCIRQIDLEIR